MYSSMNQAELRASRGLPPRSRQRVGRSRRAKAKPKPRNEAEQQQTGGFGQFQAPRKAPTANKAKARYAWDQLEESETFTQKSVIPAEVRRRRAGATPKDGDIEVIELNMYARHRQPQDDEAADFVALSPPAEPQPDFKEPREWSDTLMKVNALVEITRDTTTLLADVRGQVALVREALSKLEVQLTTIESGQEDSNDRIVDMDHAILDIRDELGILGDYDGDEGEDEGEEGDDDEQEKNVVVVDDKGVEGDDDDEEEDEPEAAPVVPRRSTRKR